MASSTFETLPEELRLKIFRRVEPLLIHMTNLRLVCKAFVPSATELLFEEYRLVLWLHDDGSFGEQSSFRLLKENPKFAELVKDVKITYAIGSTYDIQYGLRLRYHTMTAEMHEKSLLATMCKALRTTEDEIPPQGKESIKRFYERFGADLDSKFGYGEPRWDNLTFEMKSKLDLFLNVRSIGVRNAYFYETPLFSDIAKFWRETGLQEPWNILLALEIVGNHSFPYHFQAMQAGLEAVQERADTIAFKIAPFQRFPGHRWETPLSEVFTLRPEFFQQVKSLTVDVWPIGDILSSTATVAWKPALQWVRFIQKFESLTTLELINDSMDVNFNSEAVADFSMFRDFATIFLDQIGMPGVERVHLRGWAIHLRRLMEINRNFPKLQSLEVTSVALLGRSLHHKLSMWYEAAEILGEIYEGSCALRFGGSPIMEAEGSYNDAQLSDYSVKRRIIAFLKPPALDVLSAVSRRTTRDDQLYQTYKDLVRHEQPKAQPGSIPETEISVETSTPGMRIKYYSLESDQHVVSSHEGPDSTQTDTGTQDPEVTPQESA
ncbi:hypothetical protein BDV96DRAFT_560958 [Lophiotrema nucula]|uniref:F-box domain-containing protein n=1 Tax=Lophiotrema nucula TaxID=690887 RepID=A0A6A5ZSR4_9PLEO|nr:hypothetical protein BDV96DRAFT_560958 [Lophiotrema nucula]